MTAAELSATEWMGTTIMKLNRIGYFIKEGVNSIFNHGFMSFASVGVIVACLLIMGSFSLIAVNLRSIITNLEDENQMIAYVNQGYEDGEARALQGVIEAVPNVSGVEFVSKETAFDSFKEQYEDTGLLDDVDSSILRHRYIVYMDDISLMGQTQDALLNIEGITEVSSHPEIARGFVTVRNVVSIASVLLIAILFVISLFIMSNTVKLTTFERREEIAIMKMVGATSSFIRWPFIVEGLILGIFGACVAYVAQWGIYTVLAEKIISSAGLAFLNMMSFNVMAIPLLIVFMAIGFGVGVIGSSMAIRNYLKV